MRSKGLQWSYIAVGLLVIAVYQTAELATKLGALRTLNRFEHPEAIPYGELIHRTGIHVHSWLNMLICHKLTRG